MDDLDSALARTGDDSLGGRAELVLMDGPMGVGKTATAVHWGHQVTHHFPDGVLFADLRGFNPAGRPALPSSVLRGFLQALGEPQECLSEDIEQLGARFRTLLTGKRVLIMLDDAADAGQVRPLLPAESGCLVMVTSRNRMQGLVARDGARRVTLLPMTLDEGVELLSVLSGGDVADRRARALVEMCCHLPLLIRVAAAKGVAFDPSGPPEGREYAELLRNLSLAGDETTTLSALLSSSYQMLDPEEARSFRLLGTGAAGRFTVRDAAMLMETGTVLAERLLSALADIHLVRRGEDGRFSFDAILRAFAYACIWTAEADRKRV